VSVFRRRWFCAIASAGRPAGADQSGSARYTESGTADYAESCAADYAKSCTADHAKSGTADHAEPRAADHPKSGGRPDNYAVTDCHNYPDAVLAASPCAGK